MLSEPGAITDPGLVVGFMTDGIVTTRPLTRLERVKEKADKKEKKELGDWEHEVVTGMMSLQSGFYTDSSQTKMRGTRKAFIGGAYEDLRELLIDKVLPEWRKPRNHARQKPRPRRPPRTRGRSSIQ